MRWIIEAECLEDVVENRGWSIVGKVETGHWNEGRRPSQNTHSIVCSVCGDGITSKGAARSAYTATKYRFCPHCGARMEVDE